jgi:hypothetical protein
MPASRWIAVAALVEQRELKPNVKVHGADVRVGALGQRGLLHDWRRSRESAGSRSRRARGSGVARVGRVGAVSWPEWGLFRNPAPPIATKSANTSLRRRQPRPPNFTPSHDEKRSSLPSSWGDPAGEAIDANVIVLAKA